MLLNFTYFTLSGYADIGLFKYISFLIVLCLYLSILGANLLLVYIICTNRTLQEPMYVFLCSLFLNEINGSTALSLLLLNQVLRDVHQITVPGCFAQTFCLNLYGGGEFLNLAVMSYDRYLAICCPLEYHARMTPNRIAFLVALTWVCPCLLCVIMTFLSASLKLCVNVIHKVYCANHSIVKAACSGTALANIWGLVVSSCIIFVPLMITFVCYFHILRVCFSGSGQTRHKAVSTCTPHIASLLNFSFGVCFDLMTSRFDMSHLPSIVSIIMSLYWLMCPPLFNPLIYGLNLSKIKVICKSLFYTNTSGTTQNRL